MSESESQKVILRFVNGKMLKGFITDLKLSQDILFIQDESNNQLKVRLKELKAIFFVRRFEGDRTYHEKKAFGEAPPGTKSVFVKFKDGENMMGHIVGEVPWERGFFKDSMKEKGFYILPADEGSNNIKTFVVTSAVTDVAMIGS